MKKVEKLSSDVLESSRDNKQQIRCLISNIYDIQKLRIAAGNRIVQSFYIQLGIKPSTSPDNADKEEKKMIDRLKIEYKKISDGVAENLNSIKKQIKELSKNDKDFNLIRTEMDYKLVDSYMMLLKSEEEAIKVLDKYVKSHPLYDAFFEPIKGCGTLMSAVCIAYLDPRKADHVSSFFKYCGLDTVQDVDKDGNKLFLAKENGNRKVRQKFCYNYECDGSPYYGNIIVTDDCDSSGTPIITSDTGEILIQTLAMKNGEYIYEDIETEEEYIGEVVSSLHGRRKGDTEMYPYTDKDTGETKWKRGITYNPIVKTKLMGVLTGCLLKAKDPTYSTIYYDYRSRLDNSSNHKDYTDGRKNMMAQRYMIKQFLRNLWTTWRQLEGLTVDEPYEVAKLGNKPHHYNEYQCKVANGEI